MDPVCHTLVGAVLASTGLERKTRFGRATLIIGANLPDVDVVSYAWGETAALGFRRGITHGVPALIILPVLLAAAVTWLGGFSKPRADEPVANFKWLWLLSAIAVVSHPVLDFLNVYGVRWLMPFDGTWFYGDVLYIVDPWMWLIFALTLIAARRRKYSSVPRLFARPACIGLLVALTYVIAMASGEWIARSMVTASLADSDHSRFMVAPVPVDPFERAIVIDAQSVYRLGVVELFPKPRIRPEERRIPKGEDAAARQAAASGEGRIFLDWARFPFFEIDHSEGNTAVSIIDARYTLDRDATFGAIRIPLATTESELGP